MTFKTPRDGGPFDQYWGICSFWIILVESQNKKIKISSYESEASTNQWTCGTH